MGIKLYFYAKSSFCFKKNNMATGHVTEHPLLPIKPFIVNFAFFFFIPHKLYSVLVNVNYIFSRTVFFYCCCFIWSQVSSPSFSFHKRAAELVDVPDVQDMEVWGERYSTLPSATITFNWSKHKQDTGKRCSIAFISVIPQSYHLAQPNK